MDVPCLVISVLEDLVAVLTLVPLVELHLLVDVELILALEALPAVPLPAQERSSNMVLAMSPHDRPLNCLKSTDSTGEFLWSISAVSFVRCI